MLFRSTFRGWCASLNNKKSWLCYDDVEFNLRDDAYVIVCARADDNTELLIREKSAKGCFKGEIRIAGQREKGRPRIHADMEVEAKYAPQLRHVQK